MPVNSKLLEVMPAGYGYVVFTAVGSIFTNMWMGINVGRARKRLGVKYPAMYSETSNEFNCIQRAHQNSLEGHPSFLFLLIVGGLQYPKISAVLGHVYILGRIAFTLGYYTGEPDKRKCGGVIMHIAELLLLGCTTSFAGHQLGWFNHCCGGTTRAIKFH
ncbi:hypothetical protein CAPTEDRAFT_172925 [Capitella teleta]|uniref:Glutathione S-transferase 3, mitochondrial n=1 Tax=Capitella teleta TaxID=283909 RepID=R7UTI8_CAPTE|nr:hypothetical protein CAPTEDRAFT_172925 [Capitella teleta]|eukprot:ELU09829.1 hypothetical protein CAPTEDRAFT_172925 [Capitella teleta]